MTVFFFFFDRSKELSVKAKGRGLCFLINSAWYREHSSSSHFALRSWNISLFSVIRSGCQEFTAVVTTVVYISPQADKDVALKQLHATITKAENSHPEAALIISIKSAVRAPHSAFVSGDKALEKEAWYDLCKTLKAAKRATWGQWFKTHVAGTRHNSDFRAKKCEVYVSHPSLPDMLCSFALVFGKCLISCASLLHWGTVRNVLSLHV